MKSIVYVIAVLVAWGSASCIAPQPVTAQPASVSLQLFYDELSPYGMWVEYQSYGYAWIPNDDPGFTPYVTAGHWVLANDDWTWVSDYPWGWATFHYGRWDCDAVYGWVWIPGSEWGPAWVSWRRSPGYYGWRALAPAMEHQNRNDRWAFVKVKDFAEPDIGRYIVNQSNNEKIMRRSAVIANSRRDNKRRVTYATGPNRDDVERAMHMPITSIVIRDGDRPGSSVTKGALLLYRPRVQQRNDDGQIPAPRKAVSGKDARTMLEKNAQEYAHGGLYPNAASAHHPSESPTSPPPRVVVTERRIWIGEAPTSSRISQVQKVSSSSTIVHAKSVRVPSGPPLREDRHSYETRKPDDSQKRSP